MSAKGLLSVFNTALGSSISAGSALLAQKMQQNYNDQMYEKQKKDSYALLENQRHYDSPTAQLGRLQDAGLSRWASIGSLAGDTGITADLPEASTDSGSQYLASAGNTIGNLLSDLSIKKANVDKLNAETEDLNARTDETKVRTEDLKQQSSIHSIDAYFKDESKRDYDYALRAYPFVQQLIKSGEFDALHGTKSDFVYKLQSKVPDDDYDLLGALSRRGNLIDKLYLSAIDEANSVGRGAAVEGQISDTNKKQLEVIAQDLDNKLQQFNLDHADEVLKSTLHLNSANARAAIAAAKSSEAYTRKLNEETRQLLRSFNFDGNTYVKVTDPKGKTTSYQIKDMGSLARVSSLVALSWQSQFNQYEARLKNAGLTDAEIKASFMKTHPGVVSFGLWINSLSGGISTLNQSISTGTGAIKDVAAAKQALQFVSMMVPK